MQLYYPEEPSVLQAEMIVAWKKKRGSYNFSALPETAIITVDYAAIKHLVSLGVKKLKGLKGRHFIKKGLLFCAGFDNGAGGIINLLEELRALGVKQFVFIGLAGILSPDIKEGNIYAVEKAISGVGSSAYYSAKTEMGTFDVDFYKQIQNALGVQNGTCFSIDTPFRETRRLLHEVQQKGAQLIEMECAAVYSFAAFYQLQSICLLIAADNLTKEWTAPKNWKNLLLQQKHLVHQIVQTLQ
jgi:uridine phosphorylase